MNSIPRPWQYKKLGEMFDFIGGGTPSKKQADFWNGNISWASVKDIKGDYLNETQDSITEKGLKSSASNIAEKGDVILITRILPGKSIIANIRTAINQDLKIAKPRFKTTSKFIHYFFNSIERDCINQSSGTTVLGITLNNLHELRIPDLPLSEQTAIVSKIEELLSDLENGKQQLLTAQQQLKTYRQSLLKWAFEGRLTNKNVNGELPKGWKLVTVKDVCDKIVGGGTPSTSVAEYWNGNTPWITSADIYGIKDVRPRKKVAKKGIENSTINLLSKGGIIVVTRVSLGRIAIAPFDLCFSQDCQGLILNEDLISKQYALWVLHKAVQVFIHQSRGTTIKGVTKKQLEDLQFALPSLKEQEQIVSELESKLTVCDKMEETITTSLQQAEMLKQSILKKAFEGKLL